MSATEDNRAEITAQQAAELVARARAAAQGDTRPEDVQTIRDLLELRITSCNRWVSTLLEWARRGLVVEAASVDESYPDLCKCSHALLMAEDRLPWDQACNRAGVPLNSRIDEAAYLELSDAVGDASSLDEFAQRFQFAVLARKPLAKRMKALQELLAAAPRNEALRRLSKRYEEEALATLEAGCRAAAAEGRLDELEDALDAIDGLGWESQFSAAFMSWIRGEISRRNRAKAMVRFRALIPRVEAAFASRDLALLGTLIEEAEEAQQAHGTEPDDEFRLRTRDAFDWADGERQRLRIEAEHADDCESMRRALDQGFGYTELEPIRGRILSHGIGVPDDVEARFETAAAAWRSARRRKTSLVVGMAVIAVAAMIGVVLHLSREQAERARAVDLGARVDRLVDEAQFGDAQQLLDSSLREDPWMAGVAEVDAAAKRVADGRPRYERRREDVRALLAPPPEDQLKEESKISDRVTALLLALQRTGTLERLTKDEAAQAASQVEVLQERLTRIRADRLRRFTEEFDQLRREAAILKSDSDRPATERGSAEATKVYLVQVSELEAKLVAFLARAPVDMPERVEAQRIRDRLAKDAAASRDLLPRLEKVGTLLARLGVKPNSESEYVDLVRQISGGFGDLAATADPVLREELPRIQLALPGAEAIEHWRSTVLPQITAADLKAEARKAPSIPSGREQAMQVQPALTEHLASFPRSPYEGVAKRWLALCRIAESSNAESAGAAALESAKQLGILDIARVRLRDNRYAYCRNDGNGKTVLGGLLNDRADLLAGLGQLRTVPSLKQQIEGPREPTSWTAQLTAARDRLLTAPMEDVRIEWLRMLARIVDGSPPAEWIASAPVMLELMSLYCDHLADEQELDKDLCGQLRRIRTKYQAIDSCNWPALAISPANEVKRHATALRVQGGLFPELPRFAAIADQQAESWQASAKAAAPVIVVGVLLPAKPGESFRRCSPPELTGPYVALCLEERTNRPVLREITLADGKLEGLAAGAPGYALIFTRTSR